MTTTLRFGVPYRMADSRLQQDKVSPYDVCIRLAFGCASFRAFRVAGLAGQGICRNTNNDAGNTNTGLWHRLK
jgi:hypothetical protein